MSVFMLTTWWVKKEKRMLRLVNRNLENFNRHKMNIVTALTLWRGMVVSLYLCL